MTTLKSLTISPFRIRYFNEQGRLILDDLSLGYHVFLPFVLHLGHSGVSVDAIMNDYNHGTRCFDIAETECLLKRSAKLQRADLWRIFESVYFLLGKNGWFTYRYPGRCYNYPGYAGSGRVAVDFDEWTLGWTVKSGQKSSRRLR